MTPTTYERASDANAAIKSLVANGNAKLLAGGTTLIDLMKLHVENPARLIDVKRVPLMQIGVNDDGGLTIGAFATNTAVAEHAEVIARFPVLSQALLAGATTQIRNMASVGGNLLQRTRCPYFRDGISPCNKREPGTGCSAKDGDAQHLAVLGTSDACYAAHPSDMAVALVALDAVVGVEGPEGKREVPVETFHLLPGRTPHVETVLARDELITHVTLPASPRAGQSAYFKTRERASYAFALASCAAAVELNGTTIASVRVALGGVGAKPWRAVEAERILTGQDAGDALFRRAAEAALAGAKPLTDNAYKVELAKRVIVKTLRTLCASA